MKTDLKKDIGEAMIAYIASRLGISREVAAAERKRLLKKYGVESTEYVFLAEYGIPYDDFVAKTYLSIDPAKYDLTRDQSLIGALNLLERPKSILTNNPSEFARLITGTLGVERQFEKIIGSREMGFKLKPDKAAFLAAAEQTGYDLKTTAFVDDLPEFLAAAKELGMTTVLVGDRRGEADLCLANVYDIGVVLA